MAIYGIDLGTTFCSVAYVEHGRPHVVTLEDGKQTLASLVLLEAPDADTIVATVGRPARRKYRALLGGADAPPPGVALVRGSKNYIGVREQVVGGPPWQLGERPWYATDVAAVILRALAQMVRTTPGLPPLEGVVVTHPQRFRNSEKLATAQAVKLAGLTLSGMVTEPDAAAWAYGLHERATGARTVMVFDFGGGTLDVTVLKSRAADDGGVAMDALGSYGVQLGGLQLDERIREGLAEKYAEQTHDPGWALAHATEATRERLLELAEAFKIDLNRDATSDPSPMRRARTKAFRAVHADGSEGDEVRLRVSLGEVSAWINGEIDRALSCADEALARSKSSWAALDQVLLTGGSSQLIALQQRMRERAGDKVQVVFDEQDHPLRPSTIVAVGAALYGASLQAAGGGARPAVAVRGVVPDAFSVLAYRPAADDPSGRRAVLHTLIEAGTATPYVGKAQFAMRGGGRTLPVQVYEGRTLEEASCLGTFRLEFDRDLADGAPVEVQLRVAPNGALVLGVQDASTGGEYREAPLSDAPALYSDREMDDRADWLQSVRLEYAT